MIGGEYKKERFSERLTASQNQPKNRGYLPGTQPKTGGYGTGTLMGNWSEERSDAGYYDGKAVVKPGLRVLPTTTYREMVQKVESASSASHVPPAVGSITSATSSALAASPCDRRQFSQATFVEIEDRTESSYPAHQPHLDPAYQNTVKTAYRSTFQMSYISPEERLQAERECVPRVLSGNPSSPAEAVLRRLRHALRVALDGGELTTPSLFPGNVIRSIRKTVAASCTDPKGNINAAELHEGFAAAGVNTSADECTVLVRHFDQEGYGTAAYTVIVNGLRGNMCERRANLVESVYGHLKDLSKEGVVRLNNLVEWIDLSYWPAVASETVSEDAVRCDFRDQWDLPFPSSHVSLERFISYFADFSFEVAVDNVFELTMRNMWHFSGGVGCCENQSCRRVLVTRTNGQTTREVIKDDLLIKGAGAEVEPLLLEQLTKQGIKNVKSIRVVS
ncbi:hypothetical protein ABB37_02486 [Leptomonas pyrrhocoris]|uniref:Uncharacterized protein n=1 Tax=Leptomonas pyrrhocoris TaxID=157538 RepID=A0A0N0DX84_LEPPY|nr:hypothetical protein ABB37_02486 [Leptomonas pyrrhocoris]KPA82651.1 hypothetical protein ABB37_02486 [Leptomonas pyrrhocoris]|eukprot:XP_015661090.1 hypothetical protein ABB37_02486 [Leptomonas pyrrhocoris]